MHLSHIGRIVQEEWLRTPDIRPEVALDEFIIMPDHMHMIVWIRDVTKSNVGADGIRPNENDVHDMITHRTPPLGNIIRGFKGSVTHRIQNEIVGAMENATKSNVGADGIRPLENGEGACDAPRHKEFEHESIWQRNYYERIVRDERELRTFRNYIIDNPIKG
jgi:REP element-mobilizing transposase RayT